MEARWYQTEAKNAFFNYFQQGFTGNPIIALPTGSGKSFTISDILCSIYSMYPNQRILVGTHVKELIRQNYEELLRIWPLAPAGIYSAGLNRADTHQRLTYVGIGSIARRVAQLFGHVDLFFIDECHLLGSSEDGMYLKVISALQAINPKMKIIGFTATAWRTGMGLLTNGPIFTDIIYDICNIPGFARLFADGHLVPPRSMPTVTEYDMTNVRTVAGDFSKGELQEATRNEKVTWAAVQESLHKGRDRNCRLVFCTGVDHAILANEMLNYAGCKSAVVHSRMNDKERDYIMAAWLGGEFDTLTNNGIATTGVNCPRLDHIIMLRPTRSVGLWVQMLGRGTRPFELNGWYKQDCLVTDHAGNARRLGTIDDPIIPKLKTSGGSGDAPCKICPACGSYNHTSARICLFCHEPFIAAIGYRAETYTEALVSSDLPIVESFTPTHVYYTYHIKKGAPEGHKPVLRAVYQCGSKTFSEVVAFEAQGFVRRKAEKWWMQRFQGNVIPNTVDEALKLVDKLTMPKLINVHVNKKYPEILGYEY